MLHETRRPESHRDTRSAAASPRIAKSRPQPLAAGDARTRQVQRIQDQLQWLDLLDEEVKAEAHGTFGPATTWGVESFQQTAGLEATGEVDADTREALDVALAAQTRARAVPPPVNPEDSGREVERIQAAMVELGLYRPQAAERQQGRYTGKLVRAVRQFQQQRDNLDAASGAVGPETWRALIDELGPRVAGNAAAKGIVLTGRPPVEVGSIGEFAAEAERLLQGWGADVQVDRNFTREDRAATRSFQEANGLTPDGRIGTATAAALTSGRAKAIPTTTSGDTTPAHGSGPEWLLSFLQDQGLEGDQLRTIWAIGMRESRATPDLTTHGGEEDWANPDADPFDVGLFQVNSVNLPTIQERYGPDADMRLMLDPVKNYDLSRHMSANWTNLLPWGLEPDGTFNWSYYKEEWLARYQAGSEAEFTYWFGAFRGYARAAGLAG